MKVTLLDGSTMELRPGQTLCGVGITSVEITVEDWKVCNDPYYLFWLRAAVMSRLCPKHKSNPFYKVDVNRQS